MSVRTQKKHDTHATRLLTPAGDTDDDDERTNDELETTNGGGALKSQIKKSASHSREVAWTLKFESFQSTESIDPQRDTTSLDGDESFLPLTPNGDCYVRLPF